MQHPAGLIQRVRSPPAPVVKFLLNTSAALIQGVASQVHDVEGVHDCPRVGAFFPGGAFEPSESIHREELDALAPRIGLGGQQVLKICLERPGTMSKSREGRGALGWAPSPR